MPLKELYLLADSNSVLNKSLTYHYHISEFNNIEQLMAALHENEPFAIIYESDLSLSLIDLNIIVSHIKKLNYLNKFILINPNNESTFRLEIAKLRIQNYYSSPVDSIHLLSKLDEIHSSSNPITGVLLVGLPSKHNLNLLMALNEINIKNQLIEHIEEALAHTIDNKLEIIICDSNKASINSIIDFIWAVRQLSLNEKVPFILLADSLSPEARSDIMNLGSVYVLPRYVNTTELAEAIKREVSRIRSNCAAILTEPSTGLYHYIAIYHLLEVAINQKARSGLPLSLVLIKLQGINILNQSYGRIIGDQIIRKFTQCLHSSIRITDLIGHYSSLHQFLIIMPTSTTLSLAELVIKRIHDNWDDEVFVAPSGATFSVSFISGASEHKNESGNELILEVVSSLKSIE